MDKALDFVPENIYDHYLKAWETGRDINFACAIRQFLKAVGIAVRTDGEIDNFTQTMKIRCSGSRNNSMKNREQDGNRLAAKSGRQFDNTFMKAFLDYAINGKKVLVEDENHVITKRDFSKGEEA